MGLSIRSGDRQSVGKYRTVDYRTSGAEVSLIFRRVFPAIESIETMGDAYDCQAVESVIGFYKSQP